MWGLARYHGSGQNTVVSDDWGHPASRYGFTLTEMGRTTTRLLRIHWRQVQGRWEEVRGGSSQYERLPSMQVSRPRSTTAMRLILVIRSRCIASGNPTPSIQFPSREPWPQTRVPDAKGPHRPQIPRIPGRIRVLLFNHCHNSPH